MPKVSKQTAGTMGLMAAILYIIGNVVGIGIFFKNGTVFKLNYGNALGVLLAWIVSTVIVLCMALSFAEVSSCKMKDASAGLGGWAQQFCGHKFGRYAKTGYNLIFWPANTFAIMFFAGEAILNCFAPLLNGGFEENVSSYDFGRGTTAYIFIIGIALFAIFLMANYFKAKAMGKVGSIISFVKFVPILMVVILGIAFGILYNNGGAWATATGGEGHFIGSTEYTGKFNVMGIFSSIPAILFAFEGYISVGNVSGEIKNPEKNLSLSVILAVIIIAVLYLAVTIGCITSGSGDVYTLFKMLIITTNGGVYNPTAYKVLTMAISIFIFICLIGCINGMCRGGVAAFQGLCENGDLFKGKQLVAAKPGNKVFAGTVSFAIIVGLWVLLLIIPSSILNTDAMADGSSTSMVVMLYVIYGVTIAGGFMNRFTKKVEVRKQKLFPVTAVVGVLASLFVVGFVSFYQFLAAPIIQGVNKIDGSQEALDILNMKSGWGMFVNNSANTNYSLTNGAAIGWFWGMTAFTALLPIFNDLMIKFWDKTNKTPLLWQKVNKGIALK